MVRFFPNPHPHQAGSVDQTNLQPRISRSRFSNLRVKTVCIITITLVGLLVALFIPLQIFLRGSYIELENQIVSRNAERAASGLDDSIATLNRTAGDYAAWDDTYNFVV